MCLYITFKEWNFAVSTDYVSSLPLLVAPILQYELKVGPHECFGPSHIKLTVSLYQLAWYSGRKRFKLRPGFYSLYTWILGYCRLTPCLIHSSYSGGNTGNLAKSQLSWYHFNDSFCLLRCGAKWSRRCLHGLRVTCCHHLQDRRVFIVVLGSKEVQELVEEWCLLCCYAVWLL
jgi:hypothetical protein